MSFNATNPSAGRLYEKLYVKLHHTDINLSSLCALITIKICKSAQSIVEDCSTHGRESVLCDFQCPLQPSNNSKVVQVMTIAFKHKSNNLYVSHNTGT